MPDLDDESDSQDMAEIFDETHITEDGGDIAHPDMERDVYDVTTAEDDGDPDQPTDTDDFDPDEVDETELELMLEEDDGVDESRALARDDADLVADDGASTPDHEGANPSSAARARQESRLDADLEATFPASDPFGATRRGD
jgi:hypothetical protein